MPAAELPAVRDALLELHRAVVAAERVEHERVVGRTTGAGFLQALVNDFRHAWFFPLTELIVRLDEATAAAERGEEPLPAEELVAAARGLLAPPDDRTAFGRRYTDLLQRDPGVVMAHAGVVGVLRGRSGG